MKKVILTIINALFLSISVTLCQGVTYQGTYTPSSRIEINGRKNFIIDGKEIKSVKNHCITLWACHNVIIRNCKFGPSSAFVGIYLCDCSNVKITNCIFEDVATALLAQGCSGNIKFENNEVKNVNSKKLRNYGSMVLFNEVRGVGNSICYNICENIAGESYPGDIISLYKSNGTSESPIKVCNNWIRGGGPADWGGGIMLGDCGGSYFLVENNILVDPGQYGIAVASGHHITVRYNKIYARRQEFCNVGLYAWNQTETECHDLTIAHNEINYTSKTGDRGILWFAENVGKVAGTETNIFNPQLKSSILPAKIIGRKSGVANTKKSVN